MANKTIGIVIIVFLILILIAYGVWVYISYRNKTGFFAPFKPTLGPGLIPVLPDSAVVPLTPEVQAKKMALINAAKAIAASKRLAI